MVSHLSMEHALKLKELQGKISLFALDKIKLEHEEKCVKKTKKMIQQRYDIKEEKKELREAQHKYYKYIVSS